VRLGELLEMPALATFQIPIHGSRSAMKIKALIGASKKSRPQLLASTGCAGGLIGARKF